MLKQMGKYAEARKAYLQAIQEWGAWAEPYFAIGKLHYELGQWKEAVAWFSASIRFEPDLAYFCDDDMYAWGRYDLLAVCLSKLGQLEEAYKYGKRALEARPDDPRLIKNMEFYV